MSAYSRAFLLPCALLLVAARAPRPPSGELVLDAVAPVITVEIAGVPLRLRVDLDQQDSIELNPAAAARLPVKWEDGLLIDVGRVRLSSHIAPVLLHIAGRIVPAQVAEHGRDCCQGTDGAIGPDLLPYATIRWRREAAPSPNASLFLSLDDSPSTGLSAASETTDVRLRFSLAQADTIGTAAAGAALARLWDGHWSGPPRHVTVAFGVSRPARAMSFARPGLLAGFRIDQLPVRLSDFAGDTKLPAEPVRAEDVVVSHGLERQHAWPAVTIAGDRLSRCAELVYNAVPRSLTLHCAFDRP
jgi:hypothetical protein